MDDVNPVEQTEESTATPAVESQQAESTPDKKVSATVPYERFREVNQKYRKAEAELESLKQQSSGTRNTPNVDGSNDVEVLKELAKQAGLVSRDDILKEQIDSFGEQFAEIHDDYYGANPEGDANWKLLQEELKLYKTPTTLKQMEALLEKAHKSLFGQKSSENELVEAKELGKREALVQTTVNRRASIGGGSSVQTPARSLPAEVESRLSKNPALRAKQIEIMNSLED